jgi:hypothetical protein
MSGTSRGCKTIDKPKSKECIQNCGDEHPIPIPWCVKAGELLHLGTQLCDAPWLLQVGPRIDNPTNSRSASVDILAGGQIGNTSAGSPGALDPSSSAEAAALSQPSTTARNPNADSCMSGNWSGGPINYWDTDAQGRAMGAEACYQGAIPKGNSNVCNVPAADADPQLRNGHLIGNMIGGDGQAVDGKGACTNITPINWLTNYTMRSVFEYPVKRLINSGQTVYARVVPEYRGSDPVPFRINFTIVSGGMSYNYSIANGHVTSPDGSSWKEGPYRAG